MFLFFQNALRPQNFDFLHQDWPELQIVTANPNSTVEAENPSTDAVPIKTTTSEERRAPSRK